MNILNCREILTDKKVKAPAPAGCELFMVFWPFRLEHVRKILIINIFHLNRRSMCNAAMHIKTHLNNALESARCCLIWTLAWAWSTFYILSMIYMWAGAGACFRGSSSWFAFICLYCWGKKLIWVVATNGLDVVLSGAGEVSCIWWGNDW